MVDVAYILTIVAFFALMVAFVRWCEHIIGKDDGIDLPYDETDDVDDGVSPTGAAPSANTTSTTSIATPEELPV
jgi:hypothetical protein